MTDDEYLINISGTVQGVGYRAFAQKEAAGLGVSGYAKNLANGGVEVLAQGSRRALDDFIDRLRQGPRLADVVEVSIVRRRPVAAYGSFEVRD
jgi:acylphosphatase